MTACSGGNGYSPLLSIQYYLYADTTPPLTVPLAIGESVTINVQEQKCRVAPYGPSKPAPYGTGCDAMYVPAVVTGVVDTKWVDPAHQHEPCNVDVRTVGPGRLVATRTGPGDPAVTIGNNHGGGCVVEVHDPQTNASNGSAQVRV
jgi:hypothetical protein